MRYFIIIYTSLNISLIVTLFNSGKLSSSKCCNLITLAKKKISKTKPS